MAPKKAQSKRTPTPASSYTSSSEDEPENQDKPSQVPVKSSGAALKARQSDPPKRPQLSSEDDTDESSDSDPATQEKLDDEIPPSTKRPPQQKAKEAAASSDSESDSESESESESDEDSDLPPSVQRESRIPDPSVKPTVSKPTGVGAASTKKRKVSEESSGTPRKRIERLWSAEDEMAILKAILAFKKKYGRDPSASAEVDILYNEAKMSFHADFSRSQLGTKLANLKRKYSKLLTKGQSPKKKSDDADVAFDLAKEIWGERNKNKGIKHEGANLDLEMSGVLENGGNSSKGKSKGDGAESGPSSLNELGSISEGDDSGSSIIDFVANEFNWIGRGSLNKSFALLGPADCKTIEEIWNQLKLREMEFQIQRLEAAKEIIKVLKDKMND